MNKKHILNVVIAVGIVISLLAVIPVKTASASTYVVNDAGDASDANPGDNICRTNAGTCTLRAALEEANFHSGPDTIQVPAMTIVLSENLRTIYRHGYDSSVTINGTGQNATIIDGDYRTRAFFFEARSGNHKVSNLTIRNAYNLNTTHPNSWVRNGGGIFSEANLTVENVTITNSRAYQGGGIYGQHAFSGTLGLNIPSLNLKNVTLTGNSATSPDYGYAGGGGLFSGSVLVADGLTITNNSAKQGGGFYHNSLQSFEAGKSSVVRNFYIANNSGIDGGGVDNDLGNVEFINGTIENNTATGCRPGNPPECTYTGGGGIYHNDGTMNLTEVVVRNNNITTPGGYGGGIYNWKTMNIVRSSIVQNKAASGAGIFNGNYQGSENQMTILNSTIAGNEGVSGSGIDSVGGGIYNIGSLNISYTTIGFNTARYGAGINNQSGTTQLRNSILAKNVAVVQAPDCRNTIQSSGNNLVSNTANCNFVSGTGDLVNVDPNMAVWNWTMVFIPLSPVSPAINAASSQQCPAVDQLGSPRPYGQRCDMGSFEFYPQPNRVFLPTILR